MGGNPSGIALDKRSNMMYVALYSADAIAKIDPNNNRVIYRTPVGDGPQDVAFNDANGMLYVTNQGDNTVSVIDANNVIVDTITVGIAPWDIVYNPANSKMYLTNQIDGTISVIGTPPPVCACP